MDKAHAAKLAEEYKRAKRESKRVGMEEARAKWSSERGQREQALQALHDASMASMGQGHDAACLVSEQAVKRSDQQYWVRVRTQAAEQARHQLALNRVAQHQHAIEAPASERAEVRRRIDDIAEQDRIRAARVATSRASALKQLTQSSPGTPSPRKSPPAPSPCPPTVVAHSLCLGGRLSRRASSLSLYTYLGGRLPPDAIYMPSIRPPHAGILLCRRETYDSRNAALQPELEVDMHYVNRVVNNRQASPASARALLQGRGQGTRVSKSTCVTRPIRRCISHPRL
jgi:hypothetical protein